MTLSWWEEEVLEMKWRAQSLRQRWSVKKKKARTGVGMGEQGCVEKRRREAPASVVASMSEFADAAATFWSEPGLAATFQAPNSGH
jgi:hypothetical protein